VDGGILWANCWVGREAFVGASILGRHCHVGRNAVIPGGSVLGDKSVVTDYTRIESGG
jgi:NDP-sugar pyrophosphorylase family protein